MSRAPKQWALTKTETVTSFENWKQNLQYILSLDSNFAPFLVPTASWKKKSKNDVNRGFVDDSERTAAQKVTHLELMLGQIANYCPVLSRNTIVKNSTDIASIWQCIRAHYGFQSTGSHFLDLADFKLEHEERPEDLFQRLTAFFEDNLVVKNGSLSHHGDIPEEDEEVSPSLENVTVLLWLQLINKDLPKLVKQRYGTELRSRTLASIKPEISQALDSLLDELHASTVSINRMSGSNRFDRRNQTNSGRSNNFRSKPSCPLCKQVGRPRCDHFLSSCPFLPESDKKFVTRTRIVQTIEDAERDEYDDDNYDDNHDEYPQQPIYEEEYPCDESQHVRNISAEIKRVQIKKSPTLRVFFNHNPITLTLDSGAETDMIKESVAVRLGMRIQPTKHEATQADGKSALTIVGEINVTVQRDGKEFKLEALVARDIDVDVLAGIPFLDENDITIRVSRREIRLSDGTVYHYGDNSSRSRISSSVKLVRAPSSNTTIWPGEYLEVPSPAFDNIGPEDENTFAIEPRIDSSVSKNSDIPCWPAPALIQSVAGKIRIPNNLDIPITVKRNDHFAQISQVFEPAVVSSNLQASSSAPKPENALNHFKVLVNPDKIVSEVTESRFKKLNEDYKDVFKSNFEGYNGHAGPIAVKVNMGSVEPPQRKGKLPQYSRNMLEELQEKFDQLESMGVFAKPEDVGVTVEYLNPSFLVSKSDKSKRLVTAFTEVGKYTKPQPSLLPDVDSTIREIGKWKYLIKTDLTKAYYQIPLAKESMKYCGVVTPFRGVRVYLRGSMGLPGSETALEELMTRVLGDFIYEGNVAKIADDLYCGANSPEKLLEVWEGVLSALNRSNLCLAAHKTEICPKSTTILGWTWTSGNLSATKHRIATLASCDFPNTVKGLRSFIGAYKVMARVIKGCSQILSPLENYVAGKNSADKITWSDDLRASFENARQTVNSAKSITIPKAEDQLWIVTDGAVRDPGIGATLYVTRENNKPQLAGFFSAKLKKHQPSWLPCEIEALSIATAIKHFSPYIIQSGHKCCVLTDSKPCVQAYEKLSRGCYSNSLRVNTFLSTASCYNVNIRHLSGSANLPSDFSSRNAPSCNDPDCQICKFVTEIEESVVINAITVNDIESGKMKAPFTSRSAWLATQSECHDICKAVAHLKQGTRPSKKLTNIKDVKRYLRHCSVSRDDLLVVKKLEPFTAARECIVIPRMVLHGLLTALHIKLQHPTSHQLKQVFSRYFYALDLDNAIDATTKSCHHCATLRQVPSVVIEQTTSEPASCVGSEFASDVIRRSRQLILIIREKVTSFTSACFVNDEKHQTLRDGLLQLMLPLHPVDAPIATVRTDPAPGFDPLVNDSILSGYNIKVEVGEHKNINKNPVAEKGVQELEREILQADPSGDPISTVTLAAAVSRLNTRIRNRGLSSYEMWFRREQHTNSQITTPNDAELIQAQHELRIKSHSVDKKKSNRKIPSTSSLKPGDIVYLRTEGNKTQARGRYVIISIDSPYCLIRKFTDTQFRKKTYKVKISDCFLATTDNTLSDLTYVNGRLHNDSSSSESDDDDVNSIPKAPFSPPPIPAEISTIPQADRETLSTSRPQRTRSKPNWLGVSKE